MKFFTSVFFLVSLSVSLSLSLIATCRGANVLIISDIDDTIKQSHILGTKLRALQQRPFFGLSQLYNVFACESIGSKAERDYCKKNQAYSRKSDRQVIYVSGIPKTIGPFDSAWLAREFIAINLFPMGKVFVRENRSIDTQKFKIETIANILDHMRPDVVILIGDNGEYDPQIFATIEKKFSKSKFRFHSFIHQIYSVDDLNDTGSVLRGHQQSYLTAAELAYYFYLYKFIDEYEFRKMMTEVLKKLKSEDKNEWETIIPSWANCDDFQRDFSIDRLAISPALAQKLTSILALAAFRCFQVRKLKNN